MNFGLNSNVRGYDKHKNMTRWKRCRTKAIFLKLWNSENSRYRDQWFGQ